MVGRDLGTPDAARCVDCGVAGCSVRGPRNPSSPTDQSSGRTGVSGARPTEHRSSCLWARRLALAPGAAVLPRPGQSECLPALGRRARRSSKRGASYRLPGTLGFTRKRAAVDSPGHSGALPDRPKQGARHALARDEAHSSTPTPNACLPSRKSERVRPTGYVRELASDYWWSSLRSSSGSPERGRVHGMPNETNRSEHRAMAWAAIGGALVVIGGGGGGTLAAIGASSHLWGDHLFLAGFAFACLLTALGVYVLVAEFIGGMGPLRFPLPATRQEREVTASETSWPVRRNQILQGVDKIMADSRRDLTLRSLDESNRMVLDRASRESAPVLPLVDRLAAALKKGEALASRLDQVVPDMLWLSAGTMASMRSLRRSAPTWLGDFSMRRMSLSPCQRSTLVRSIRPIGSRSTK